MYPFPSECINTLDVTTSAQFRDTWMHTNLLDSYLYHNDYLEGKVTAISMTITDSHSQNKPKNEKEQSLRKTTITDMVVSQS